MYEDEELPETLEWYKDQIAGHHPSVVKNGIRQIGMFHLWQLQQENYFKNSCWENWLEMILMFMTVVCLF